MTLRGALLGVLSFLEGAVGDALQQLGVVGEGADVAPGDRVGRDVEVLVAQGLEARECRSLPCGRCRRRGLCGCRRCRACRSPLLVTA